MVTMNPQPVALVVNDDPAQLHIASTILSHDGIEVISCASAERALDALAEGVAVDVIVTDLYMPRIDGWQLCRLLRSSAYREFNRIPILVLSATFSGVDAEEITAQLGADAFLSSPYESRVLRTMVRDLLGNTRPKTLTHVLIVEPDQFEAEVLVDTFKASGYAVARAASGEEALRQLNRSRPQIVILAAELPDMSSDRLIEYVKAPAAATVAIVMTSDTSAARALELVRKGADNYLPKPFVPAYLLHLCETAMRQRALTRVEELLELRTQSLRESEERYHDLFENAGVAIAILALDSTVISVNRSFEALSGRSRDDVVGTSCRQFLTSAAYHEAAEMQEQARERKLLSWTQEIELAHWDGTAVPVEAQYRYLHGRDARPGVIMAIYRDLTAEKQLQRQRAEFSAMLAHDIRNPVGLIVGCVSLLLNDIQEPDPDLVKTFHERILDHARVLQSLVNNYLNFSTIEAGQLTLSKGPTQLGDLLRRLAQRFELEARRRSIGFAVVANDCPGLEADELALERAVANLLQNAFQFTPVGGQVTLSSEQRLAEAVVTVRDNGPGIDPQMIPVLFQKFRRLETSERREGVGLGLYIVKELVAAHGGRVEVDSAIGQGSAFSIFLPLAQKVL
jgi:PAS domain S-box-containing protein